MHQNAFFLAPHGAVLLILSAFKKTGSECVSTILLAREEA